MTREIVAAGAHDEPVSDAPVVEMAAEGAYEEASDAASD